MYYDLHFFARFVGYTIVCQKKRSNWKVINKVMSMAIIRKVHPTNDNNLKANRSQSWHSYLAQLDCLTQPRISFWFDRKSRILKCSCRNLSLFRLSTWNPWQNYAYPRLSFLALMTRLKTWWWSIKWIVSYYIMLKYK